MKHRQKGFGAFQILATLACVAAVVTVAVPKYDAYVNKSKMTEAFNLASGTKTKLTEFYMAKNRFPNSDQEAASIQTSTTTPPEYVREVVINHEDEMSEIVVQVYFKEGALSDDVTSDDFVYVAGNKSNVPGAMVEWTCGAVGIDSSLLPTSCIR